LKDLFDGKSVFDTPKPVELVQRALHLAANDGIVFDFFAGSGTTAQAVLELNRQDGGNRKFILVQLPEPTDLKEFATISDVIEERTRRVIKRINEKESAELPMHKPQDRGFRVFNLTSSNFKIWNSDLGSAPASGDRVDKIASQLELHIDHVQQGRGSEDLLFEILLKSGFPVTTRIDALQIGGKQVYSIANGEMLICLEKALTPELIKAIAERKPWRVVCLDVGFAGNDQLKTNAVQIMKSKGVTSFRTV
jgi:adenine-specific DNA-methyltransferase